MIDHSLEPLPVSLPHALRVRRLDVLLHDLLPASAAEPAPEEALHLLDLAQLQGLLVRPVRGRGGGGQRVARIGRSFVIVARAVRGVLR